MLTLIDLIKHFFISTTIVISALNPFVTKSTPTPVPVNIERIPTEIPSPIPTSLPIPKKVQPVYVDPDPIESCQNPNCGAINIKKSLCSNTVGYVCCQIGSKWTWYASRDQCTKDQNVSNQQQKQGNTYTPPTIPTYNSSVQTVSCALSYGTYQLTQSDCDNSKKSDTPQIQQQAPTPIPQDTNLQLGLCLKRAIDDYNNAWRQTNGLYGASGSLDSSSYEDAQQRNAQARDSAQALCQSQWGQ